MAILLSDVSGIPTFLDKRWKLPKILQIEEIGALLGALTSGKAAAWARATSKVKVSHKVSTILLSN